MDRGPFRSRTNPSEHDGSTGTARAVVLWGWGLALAAARRAGCNRHDDDVDLHAVAGRGVRQRSRDYRRDGDGRVYPRPALLVGRHDGGDGDLPSDPHHSDRRLQVSARRHLPDRVDHAVRRAFHVDYRICTPVGCTGALRAQRHPGSLPACTGNRRRARVAGAGWSGTGRQA